MRNYASILVAIALAMTCGCKNRPATAEARQRLVGHYALAVGRDCEAAGVRSSTLVLRADGTYDQRIEFTTGEVVNELGQRWNYDEGVHFRNFRITATGELRKDAPETETSLVADLSHPVVILLSPSSDCFYSQPK